MNINNKITWDIVLRDHYSMNNISQTVILDKISIFKNDIIFKNLDINDKIIDSFMNILNNNIDQMTLENKIILLSKKYDNNKIEYLYYILLKFIRNMLITVIDIKYYIDWLVNTNKFILSGIQILDLILYYFDIKEFDIFTYTVIKFICKFKSLFSNKLIYNKLLLTELFNNGFCITYKKSNFMIDQNVIENIKLYIEKWNNKLSFYIYKESIFIKDYIHDDIINNRIITYKYTKLNKKYDIIMNYLNYSIINNRIYKRFNETINNINNINISIILNIYMNLLKYFDNTKDFNKYINDFLNNNNYIYSLDNIKQNFYILNNYKILLLIDSKSPLILDILYNNNFKLFESLLINLNTILTNDITYIINIYSILYNNIVNAQYILKNKYNHTNIYYRIIQLSNIHDYIIKYFKSLCNNNNLNYVNYLHLFYYHDMMYINDNNNKIFKYHMSELQYNNEGILVPIDNISTRSKEVFKIITGLNYDNI
jgi:hypothetical protein